MSLDGLLTMSDNNGDAYSLPKGLGDTFGNYMLHGIEEVHLAQPISWWPQAIGWNILLLLVLLWVGKRIYRAFIKWRSNHYRRAALARLTELEQDARNGSKSAIRQLAVLLKTTALQAYPRSEVAQVSGREWLALLDSKWGESVFSLSLGECLLSISYQAESSWQLETQQLQELIDATRRWIKQHRVAKEGMPHV